MVNSMTHSADIATALREFKVKIDWGVTDNDLLTLLAPHARPDVCRMCHAIDHATNCCPLVSKTLHKTRLYLPNAHTNSFRDKYLCFLGKIISSPLLVYAKN
jgi:hypothetical protein